MTLPEKLEQLQKDLKDPTRTILSRAAAEVCTSDAVTEYGVGRQGLADACAERAADYIYGRLARPEGWDE